LEEHVRAIIVAAGQTTDDGAWRSWVQSDDLVIGADGGAATALSWGLVPHLVIGDMDSLPASARQSLTERGTRFIEHPRDKDEADLELALLHALGAGAEDIVVLGALGGRLDHTFSNILLLTVPAERGVPARIVDGDQQAMLLVGGQSIELQGQPGDLVSLLPLGGDVQGVATTGLSWSLDGEPLHFGLSQGISNVMEGTRAGIKVGNGCLLVVQISNQ
jgi:thiamine pyrophosphokinase